MFAGYLKEMLIAFLLFSGVLRQKTENRKKPGYIMG
jgi:hypothetical protein